MKDCLKRKYICKYYDQKVAERENYSLGMFARKLGIDTPTISRIIKGTRKVTDKMFRKIGPNLELSPKEIEAVIGRNSIGFGTENYSQIEEDNFKLISEWYHFAIIQQTKLKDFQDDPKWIAKKLGIRVYEAKEAMERLFSQGYLSYNKDGKVVESEAFIRFTSVGSKSANKHVMGVIQNAYKSVAGVSKEKRAHSTITVAVNEKKVDLIRSKIKNFSAELDRLLSDPEEEKNAVYQLALSFFPAGKVG